MLLFRSNRNSTCERLHSGELKWIYVTRYGHVKSPNVTMCVNLSKQGIYIERDVSKIKFTATVRY